MTTTMILIGVCAGAFVGGFTAGWVSRKLQKVWCGGLW